MHVCWRRLSFGVSVRACSLELNPTKTARIRDSVGNRADIHRPAASNSEVFQGLYRTNACPWVFWLLLAFLCWLLGGGGGVGEWLLIQLSPRPPIVHKPDKVGGHAVVHGEWQATGLPSTTLAHPNPPSSRALTPTSTPQSDGSASVHDAFITSQWQSGSCRLTPIALQSVP